MFIPFFELPRRTNAPPTLHNVLDWSPVANGSAFVLPGGRVYTAEASSLNLLIAIRAPHRAITVFLNAGDQTNNQESRVQYAYWNILANQMVQVRS